MASLYGASAEYTLHGMLVMAGRAEPVSARALAQFQELPERYLAKLLTRLEKAGLVRVAEGVRGGLSLARAPGRITVRAVLAITRARPGTYNVAEADQSLSCEKAIRDLGWDPAWRPAG